MHASPTGGQAARYDSNEPSGIPHADPNHQAISCRLPEVHAVGKPLGRKPAWWISKIATNHSNYQPNHNSRVRYPSGIILTPAVVAVQTTLGEKDSENRAMFVRAGV